MGPLCLDRCEGSFKDGAIASLRRRVYLGLDLNVPREGPGLEVIGLLPDSLLRERIDPGTRLLAINGELPKDLAGVRSCLRRLSIDETCHLQFDRGAVEHRLTGLPLEVVADARVELGLVDCGRYRLRSIYTFPVGPGPFPLVWILPGSQMVSAECVHVPNEPVLHVLSSLSRAGYATLRVERSGVGDSEGPHCAQTDLNEELSWWRAASAQAGCHPQVRADEWFLFGRSLGGVTLQLLAHELRPKAAAVWGTSSQPWHEVMLRTAVRQRALAGVQGQDLNEYREKRRRLGEAVYIRGENESAGLAAGDHPGDSGAGPSCGARAC